MTGVETLSWVLQSWGVLENLITEPETFVQTMGVEIGTAVVIFVWLIIVFWVAKDIAARSSSVISQVLSIVIVTLLTPIIGLPIYLALRPVHYRRDKLRSQEAGDLQTTQCMHCQGINLSSYTCCIFCGHHLHNKCKQCHKLFPNDHMYCYNCGAPNLEVDQDLDEKKK